MNKHRRGDHETNPMAAANARPLRFLLLDDTDGDAEPLLRELSRAGFAPSWRRAATLHDLQYALGEAARGAEQFDVIFSDFTLTRLTARDAFAALEKSELDVPFILVSATISEEDAAEAMRSGMRDWVSTTRLARLGPAVERELRESERRAERRRIEEQLVVSDRMVSVGTLAAGVAHEINNPLATVLANLELATRETHELIRDFGDQPRLTELRDILRDAREAATRVRTTVRDLKILSRADDDSHGPIDLQRVLESSIRMSWNEVRHRARLVKDYRAISSVEGNEARLGQVFLNLIVNAAQAIPEGNAGRNEIRLATWQDGEEVIAEVRDSGAGMTPEVQKRLFSPFFTTKPIGVGTGLGLSICQRIIHSLGGRISVESEVGKGSAFRVHLPVAHTVAQAAQAAASGPGFLRSEPPPARRGKILAVDDEPSILLAVARALSPHHDVLTEEHARDALGRVQAGERFDVLICDLMMPDMTGMELHAELLRVAPEQALRMIFLTGGAFTSRAREFLDQVPNVRIEKPFDVPGLRALIAERVR